MSTKITWYRSPDYALIALLVADTASLTVILVAKDGLSYEVLSTKYNALRVTGTLENQIEFAKEAAIVKLKAIVGALAFALISTDISK
jgi:hypothetical protein